MKKTFIVSILGIWGRGKTLKEAAENCHKAGAKLTDKAVAWLVLGDDKASINGNGQIEYGATVPVNDDTTDLNDNTECFVLGKFFKLSSLTKLTE